MIRLTTYLGHSDPSNTYWYLEAVPELLDLAMARATADRLGGGPMSAVALPALIQRFFTDRLCVQMEASRHTVAGYRDTFRLLLGYAGARYGKPPVKLTVEDIDADLVADFLVHTETARGNSARSRNTRLAAIRSFFRYVAMSDPTWLLHCQRILAMPNKRYVKRTVTFLGCRRDRGVAGGSGSHDMGGAARSCSAAARGPDRPSGFRTGRPQAGRCRARERRAHPLHG